ncbi:NEDD8-conjugating protein UBC12 [Sporobolomyces salmoneus]|uniref:NEDD8-conjugating protein UBC12 n=1 Tax=Sporobolomyces salmoneus TaxID=183962 RepID=UPI00317E0C4F
MMKIWSLKKNEDAAAKKKPKTSAALIRVQKDLTELDLPSTMKTHFPNPEDLLNFELTITPDEGMYKGGSFKFTFAINNNYPHDAPKVKCVPKIYHPNLDLSGNVCLNILREDWKPVLNLNAVMVGIQYLFLEPNADDPLNKDAANDLRANRDRFIQNVKSAMRGGYVGSEQFDDVRVGSVQR